MLLLLWSAGMPKRCVRSEGGRPFPPPTHPGAATPPLDRYKSMIGQAMDMKREIEEQRSRNSFGMLVWQLGEVWPTGGWGVSAP